jgi:hypothetical protein
VDPAYEKHQLRRIEHWFEINDPGLAAVLSGPGTTEKAANRRSVRLSVDLLGVLCVISGIIASALSLIFVGVLVLMVAACMHTTARRRRQSG